MAEKVVLIFTEGETDKEFYNEIVKIMRRRCSGKLDCDVKVENAKSIYRYKNKVLNIFLRKIKPKYPDAQIYIVLCYDQDVFELSQNPPVNWKRLKKDFINNGAKGVYMVKAINSIEDWFLLDKSGVLNFLNLPEKTKIIGKNGYEKLKNLFKKKNKLYVKGAKCADFIHKLDIEKILSEICCYIEPLCKVLGVKCNEQKRYCKKNK